MFRRWHGLFDIFGLSCSPKHFFRFPIFRFWAYLINVILETRTEFYIYVFIIIEMYIS